MNQARALRRATPPLERKLWEMLRSRKLDGLKFRRQFPIGPYVVDFICLRHRLIVEADGPLHDPAYDAMRDAWLRAQGFRMLRFENRRINSRDWTVVHEILQAVAVPPASPAA